MAMDKTSAGEFVAEGARSGEAPEAAQAPVKVPGKRGPKPGFKRTPKEDKGAKKGPKETAAPTLVLQFQGRDSDISGVVEKAREAFVKEGHRVSSIKSLEIYLKPEESAAYYVINGGKFQGKLDLF